jgi:hypothetical protein
MNATLNDIVRDILEYFASEMFRHRPVSGIVSRMIVIN